MTASWFRLVVLVAVVLTALGSPAVGAESVASRDFEDETWVDGLIDLRAIDLTRTSLVTGFAGNGLRVDIPEGGFRGFGPFDRIVPSPDEAWYRCGSMSISAAAIRHPTTCRS